MNDERRDGEDPPERDEEEQGGEEGAEDALEPATWAGRQRLGGLPPVEEEADEEPEGSEPAAEPEGSEPAAEDALADEGPEPGDEFEFDGDEEGVDEPEEDSGEHTVEANTLALADSEEAREAALAGLRARTKEHAAKRGITDPGQAKPPAGKDDADAEDAEAGGEEKKPAKKTISSETAPVAAVAADEEPSAAEQKAPKAGLWARFVAASFLIIVSMATATAVSILVYLTDIAKGLGGLDGLSSQLDAIDEEAQTFLILGSDVRPDDGDDRGLSDTTMLLRVDPDRNLISQLSIPRDLRVNIPGHGVDKFNAAYSYGGPKLTLEVIKKSITGEQVPINHVVNVDFNGFADAVDAIDCVYVDVDRHYLHSNVGLAAEAQYAEIDIEAGYQRLCGLKALQYVRYRHEDNDIVRAARQQGFLREARQKIPPEKLLNERNALIQIFTDSTTSDIDKPSTVVELLKLMLDARNAQIHQVPFPFASLDEEGYVTANAEPLQAAVNEFMGVGSGSGEDEGDGGSGGGQSEGGGSGPDKPDSKPKPEPPPPELIDSTASGQQYTAAIRDQSGGELKFPILYPTRLVPASTISDDSRFSRVDGPGDAIYRGYKFVVAFPGSTYPTAYYGVSGMDWPGAPLFKNPSDEREMNGRTYKLYSDAGQLRMVAFERSGVMYWVTNSLDKLLANEEMLAIAQNLAVADGG